MIDFNAKKTYKELTRDESGQPLPPEIAKEVYRQASLWANTHREGHLTPDSMSGLTVLYDRELRIMDIGWQANISRFPDESRYEKLQSRTWRLPILRDLLDLYDLDPPSIAWQD